MQYEEMDRNKEYIQYVNPQEKPFNTSELELFTIEARVKATIAAQVEPINETIQSERLQRAG